MDVFKNFKRVKGHMRGQKDSVFQGRPPQTSEKLQCSQSLGHTHAIAGSHTEWPVCRPRSSGGTRPQSSVTARVSVSSVKAWDTPPPPRGTLLSCTVAPTPTPPPPPPLRSRWSLHRPPISAVLCFREGEAGRMCRAHAPRPTSLGRQTPGGPSSCCLSQLWVLSPR